MKRLTKFLLIIIGSISVLLGFMGIFLPILPTTPFLLLAAACYIRSSEKFYNWLINHRFLGIYIKSYLEGKGIPLKTKIFAISSLWITISISIMFFIGPVLIKLLLLIIATVVTIHIISIKTLQ